MSKTILITGSTDGIGLATARKLIHLGHTVLIHGRSADKLSKVENEFNQLSNPSQVQAYKADLSNLDEVHQLAHAVQNDHKTIDVLINNAGIFKTTHTISSNGIDVRLMVNTVAPYLLTKKLLPLIPSYGRIINLASAGQAPVNLEAYLKTVHMDDYEAYAQSKLAIIMWSRFLAEKLKKENGPLVISVNPGSLLGSKMVKEGFGTDGKDINIGVDILTRLSLDDEFLSHSGEYYDNDSKQFAAPHPAGLDEQKTQKLTQVMDELIGV